MPVYEYRCLACRKKFNVTMSYKEYGEKPVVCPHCQSSNVQKLISRVRFARGDMAHMESLADPATLDRLEDDPRTLGRMMREMSGSLGEEMPAEFDEVVDRLEKGQSPEDIERELPELSSSDDASPAGMPSFGDD